MHGTWQGGEGHVAGRRAAVRPLSRRSALALLAAAP